MRTIARSFLLALMLSGFSFLAPIICVAAPVPPDLVKLEKLVGLELAHVRDAGPTDPAKRKLLSDARDLDQQAEDSIKAGDFQSAEQNLLKARVLLRQLND
jgi:hypothetical protein